MARARLIAGERDDANALVAQLEAELARAGDARHQLEEMLSHSRSESRTHEERALAAEHAHQARTAELVAAGQRIADLTGALEEGRASVEGTRGELARVEGIRAEADRRAAEATAGRDQLSRELEAARQSVIAEREKVKGLEADVQRLSRLEPLAEEATRLRREVGSLREMVQQRTQAAESASRAVQAAAAERAKVEERLSVEAGRLHGGVARLEGDLTLPAGSWPRWRRNGTHGSQSSPGPGPSWSGSRERWGGRWPSRKPSSTNSRQNPEN